jgi:hypothetical protein
MDDAFLLSNPFKPVPGKSFTSFTWAFKVIVEGKVSLYQVQEKSGQYLFISDNESEPEFLIYHEHESNGKKVIYSDYKIQLKMYLGISKKMEFSIENSKYSVNSLSKLLDKYYKENNIKSKRYNYKSIAKSTRYSLKLGYDVSNRNDFFLVNNSSDISPIQTFSIGIDVENYFRHTDNRWSLITGVSYHYSYFNDIVELDGLVVDTEYRYRFNESALSGNVGVRRYFYLNDKHALFIQTDLMYLNSFSSKLERDVYDAQGNRQQYDSNLKEFPQFFLNFGLGYQYNNRVHISFRYMQEFFQTLGLINRNNEIKYLGSSVSVILWN